MIHKDDILDILDKSDIFYTFVEQGGFRFSNKVERAGVAFNKEGKCVEFLFNEEFYNSITPYERNFVICHECLHIFFKHGIRSKSDILNKKLQNIAMDVVINETLYSSYGFDPNFISMDHIRLANTFKPEQMVEYGKSYEYYFNKLKETAEEITYLEFDNHDGLGDISDKDSDELIEGTLNGVSPFKAEKLSKLAGNHHQMEVANVRIKRVVNHKMASLVTDLKRKTYNEVITSQWVSKNRRYSEIDFLLPQDGNGMSRAKSKIDLAFFADISGSCRDYSESFYNTLFSLPSNKINCRYFVFDTEVKEIRRGDTLYDGGGTSFHIIEDYIRNNYRVYPDMVFVLTDGWGTMVHPKYPDRWNIFLTYGDEYYKRYFQGVKKFFSYNDYGINVDERW